MRLDTVLLETSPLDPPPPRRSSRCTADDILPTKPIQKIKLTKTKHVHSENMINVMNGTDSQYMSSSMMLDAPSTEHDETSGNHNNDGNATGKAGKRQAKNVGGWISPDFSKDIDRSWLEGHVPPYNNKQAFHLSTYVPQIGDIVLYVCVLRMQVRCDYLALFTPWTEPAFSSFLFGIDIIFLDIAHI